MALILNIDSATETGSVCLAKDGRPLASREIASQKDHAKLMAPSIKDILSEAGVEIKDLDAVAISGGPGSYTGLRVATATAKGLCYAHNIPFIAINTLEMMAAGIRRSGQGENLFCPMIDARRMDVFTALYTDELKPLLTPAAITLEEDFLAEYRQAPVVVFGTGRDKARQLFRDVRAWHFPDFSFSSEYLAPLAEENFQKGQFEDLAYSEPFYLKSFYTAQRPK